MKKISRRLSHNSNRTRRTLELASLEPRMLLWALDDHGLDDLPANLGTFPAIHAEVDTDYPGAAASATAAAPVSGAAVPVSATAVPTLHSNSTASARLYLDFIGSSDPTWGTYNPGATPAYSQDADTSTFTDSEISSIRQIWARVAEKYAPFNIDVTTQNPGNLTDKATQKVVFGGGGAWLGAQAGGVSYVGAFYNSAPNVSFVFTDNLGAGAPKYSSEAAAHEAGHAFGLEHQGQWSGTTLVAEYNPGTSAAAPIMGNSYDATRGLWWSGHPSSSATVIQDDMSVISNTSNGFGYRPDDRGNSITAASTLGSAADFTGSGIIERTTDEDYFSFTTSGGSLTLSANTIANSFSNGATLDIKLELRNSSNTILTSSDLAGPSAEQLTASLAAGTYYVDIASHGSYGDVGQYTFNGSVTGAPVVVTVADPTGLTASAASQSRVDLAWTDNASNETNYRVQRSTDGGQTWTDLATLAADSTSYADTTVSASSSYAYRVLAYNTTTNSNYSNTATATTPAAPVVSGPPATPVHVATTADSSSQVTVVWADVDGETGYRVQRSQDGVNWTTFTVAANATSYVDTGLAASTVYSYRVISFNAAGSSAPSNTIQAQTRSAPVVTTPAAPTNLRITGGTSSSLVLAWTDNSTNETAFSVERSSNGVNWVVLGTVGANVTSVQNTGLSPYTVYYYRIRALNSAGNSAYSNTAGARTAMFSTLPPALITTSTTTSTTGSHKTRSTVFSSKPIRVY